MTLWGAHVERIGARPMGLLGQQHRAGAWACPWGPGLTLNFTWLILELALSVLVGPGWWDQPRSQRCSPEPAELAVKPKQPQMDSVRLHQLAATVFWVTAGAGLCSVRTEGSWPVCGSCDLPQD